MPTDTSRHYTWWRVSGHVAACSGDGARHDKTGGPNRVPLLSCHQYCTLHHDSVPDTPKDTHLKKPTFVNDLAGNIPAFQPIRLARSQRENTPAKSQRILSQAQPMAAHLLALTLSAKGAQ